MNLFEKLSAITAELQTIEKKLRVETGKGKTYKAVAERDVLDNVKPLEAKYKVYSYPVDREVLESNILESETEYNGKITKKTTFMTRIKTIYRFVDIEKPTEFIETTVFSEGIDTQDKGSGKAMTYADKYALMKAYKISTGDDPDVEASKEEHYTAKPKKNFEYTKAEEVAKPKETKLDDERAKLAQQLKELLEEKGIDRKEFCKQNGITKESTATQLKLAINIAGLE